MKETVKVDSKWRIVIPKKFRKNIKVGDILSVEANGDTIILRKREEEDLVEKFEAIKLTIGEEVKKKNAESGKHKYGGIKE